MPTQKLVLAAQILSVPAEGLSKLSVLFFYKRIFRGKTFELIVTIMVWIVVFWNIGFIFANLRQSIPSNDRGPRIEPNATSLLRTNPERLGRKDWRLSEYSRPVRLHHSD